jgi:hypothetical protein
MTWEVNGSYDRQKRLPRLWLNPLQEQQFPVYPKDPIQPMAEDSFGAISRPMYRV